MKKNGFVQNNVVSQTNKVVSVLYWIIAIIGFTGTTFISLIISSFATDNPNAKNPGGDMIVGFFIFSLIGGIPSILLGLSAYFTGKGSKIAMILGGVLLIGLFLPLIITNMSTIRGLIIDLFYFIPSMF